MRGIYIKRADNHQPLTDFPPPEEVTGEHYLRAKIEQESNERTQGTIQVFGQLFLPPFHETRLMSRYFFDISELIDTGQSISNVRADMMYDEADFRFNTLALLSDPLPWDEAHNIYYIEIDWAGIDIYGTMEYQFALIVDQAPD